MPSSTLRLTGLSGFQVEIDEAHEHATSFNRAPNTSLPQACSKVHGSLMRQRVGRPGTPPLEIAHNQPRPAKSMPLERAGPPTKIENVFHRHTDCREHLAGWRSLLTRLLLSPSA